MDDGKTEKMDDLEDNKIMVSVYLSSKTVEKVDDILFYAKKRLPMGKRRRLTKSVFYEAALRVIIEDQNLKGEESPLWNAISEMIQN
jgi:hypothetical protein